MHVLTGTNRAEGKIVEAYVEDFTALSKDGKMIVLIINKGHVSADFQVKHSLILYKLKTLIRFVGLCERMLDGHSKDHGADQDD